MSIVLIQFLPGISSHKIVHFYTVVYQTSCYFNEVSETSFFVLEERKVFQLHRVDGITDEQW